MYFINRFRTLVGLEKAKGAAIICVEEMTAQFDKEFRSDYTPASEWEYEFKMTCFRELINAIRSY